LMERAKHIPLWIISYSDSDTMRVIPEDLDVLAEAEGRSTEILRFPFPRSRVKKGSESTTCNECLIVCRDPSSKKGIFMPGSHVLTKENLVEASDCDIEKQSVDENLTCASLFSGIGGTDLALEMAGFHCVLACEKDEMARKAFEANFGHTPYPDVRKLEPSAFPPYDLLSAGWPCQAISVGGLRKGMDDERCQLVLEIIRIADATRPKAILLENANTLPTHDGGCLLDDIMSRFAGVGYRGWWKILDAKDFGMPTQRKRTYVVLFREDLGITTFDFPKPGRDKSYLLDVLLPDRLTEHLVLCRPDIIIDKAKTARAEMHPPHSTVRVGSVGSEEPIGQGNRIYSPFGCSATICSGGGGYGANTGLYLVNGKVRPLHPREAVRVLGMPDSFLLPVNEKDALKLIGNSVAVPVMAMIAREIAKKLGSGKGIATANADEATT
jgi:DNA (cytosine-5)-methyltransferase 1